MEDSFKDKILLEIHGRTVANTESLGRVETNLAEHMRRTHLLESKVATMERIMWMFNGASILLTVAFAIFKFWFKAF